MTLIPLDWFAASPVRRTGFAARSFVLALLLLGLGADQASAVDRRLLEAALGSIRASELKRHVEVLADDAFEGREAGSRGGRAAGGYLVERFQQAELRGRGDDGTYFQSFNTGYRNLLGLLEGSDPQLKQEVVLVGAHYDHVGYGNRKTSLGPIGYVHNGADDNASGTAALLEIIDAFKMLGAPPRRSILFALWDGEEQGLLGSRHWVAHPTVPLQKVVFALNSDMVGRLRNNKVEVLGSRTGRGLRLLTARANAESEVDIDFNWEMKPNSDHHSFYARNIPVLMLHTGLHEDYHRPSDDVEKVDVDSMERLGRFWFQVAYELADSDQVTKFRPQSQNETPLARKQFEAPAPAPAPRVGISFRQVPDRPSVELISVTPGAPGERAGLRVGDRLVRVADQPVESEDRLRLELLAARSPVVFVVERNGQLEPLSLTVQLAGNPSRVGLSWREDDAEPETLAVSLVLSGSAAARGGVRVGDRIVSVGGEPLQDAAWLRKQLGTLPSPITLVVERQGRLRTLTLEPLPPLE